MCMIHYSKPRPPSGHPPDADGPARADSSHLCRAGPHEICRAAILANEPLRVDDKTIARYALTPEEAARLRRIVKRCNTEIVAELRGQYERLAAIDCLKR